MINLFKYYFNHLDINKCIDNISQVDTEAKFESKIQKILLIETFQKLKSKLIETKKVFDKEVMHFVRTIDNLKKYATEQNQESKSILYPLFKKISNLFLNVKSKELEILKIDHIFTSIKGKLRYIYLIYMNEHD